MIEFTGCIEDMAKDIKRQMSAAIKASGVLSIQLGESTDFHNDAQITVYARYPAVEIMEENILFCRGFSTTTTGEDIFIMVNCIFNEKGLNWSQCLGISTDGAPVILGARQGFCSRVKEIFPTLKFFIASYIQKMLLQKYVAGV